MAGGLSRPPRGNGVNVHLKGDSGIVFVQENYREAHRFWLAGRHQFDRPGLVSLTGRDGKRVSIPAEEIKYLEEL